jgi:hypothetical protein
MEGVHIRRALLLFAIVLGMAALAASLSRPPEERSTTEQRKQPAPSKVTAKPLPPDNPPVLLSFDAVTDERRRLPLGRAATVEVSVDEPGLVELPGLGLSSPADLHTPARFDIFPSRADNYELLFTPAQGDESRPAGTLVVTASG